MRATTTKGAPPRTHRAARAWRRRRRWRAADAPRPCSVGLSAVPGDERAASRLRRGPVRPRRRTTALGAGLERDHAEPAVVDHAVPEIKQHRAALVPAWVGLVVEYKRDVLHHARHVHNGPEIAPPSLERSPTILLWMRIPCLSPGRASVGISAIARITLAPLTNRSRCSIRPSQTWGGPGKQLSLSTRKRWRRSC